MLNPYQMLKILNPSIKSIEVAPILYNSLEVSYEAVIVNQENFGIGGGVAKTENMAIQIAIAECFERSLYLHFKKRIHVSDNFHLKKYPTSCGFALGFDFDNTKLRSLYEAIERWAWCEWIDRQKCIDKCDIKNPSIFCKSVESYFSEVLYYKKEVTVKVDGKFHSFYFLVTLGLTELGVFAGSNIVLKEKYSIESWDHAISESMRHLYLCKKSNNEKNRDDIGRIKYFSTNKLSALKQIPNGREDEEFTSEVEFTHSESLFQKNIFLTRTIIKDYISWHYGGNERFVY